MNLKVLVVTGGFVAASERSLGAAARKLLVQWRASESAWLDLKVKAVAAEPLVGAALERLSGRASAAARAFMARRDAVELPELAEVVLGTALDAEGIPYVGASLEELFADASRREALLAECSVVFVSTTLLRDLSEVEPVVRLLRRPGNRLVLGGALAPSLAKGWEGMDGVAVLAVGYGERLVPALADWLRSGFTRLAAPPRGRLERRGKLAVLHSGLPEGLSLDELPTPDWAAAAKARGIRPRVVHYESVRGCPYRCSFCNYPFLFDDTLFRYKSARRIADDWCRYASELGVEAVSCLDSLFTVPPKRLRELCAILIGRGTPVKWLCYARADDLADLETARLMRAAGCVQVQIGLESGDAQVLANMNKRCTPEANLAALENCRSVGITSVVSLVVGFPGETAETLERTYAHLAAGRPDFHFLATFSTRAAGVPVLSEESRRRFGLRTASSPRTVAPYWTHDTMSCAEVGGHVRALSRRLMLDRVSLDASLFYGAILWFRPELRADLLDFQRRAAGGHAMNRAVFDRVNTYLDGRLAADIDGTLSAYPISPREPEYEVLHA